MKDVRYLALRAFGCLTNIIDKSECDSLFNDTNGKDPNDDAPAAETCPLDMDQNTGHFPWGHKAVTFVDPKRTPKPTTAVWTRSTTPAPVISTTNHSKTESALSMFTVLITSMFLWLSACTLM